MPEEKLFVSNFVKERGIRFGSDDWMLLKNFNHNMTYDLATRINITTSRVIFDKFALIRLIDAKNPEINFKKADLFTEFKF